MNNENIHTDPIGLLPKVFAGESSPEENRAVEEWLASDPANRILYDDIYRIWNLAPAAAVPGEIDIEREWQRMETSMNPARTVQFGFRRIMQIAASLILVSVLAFIGLKITGSKSASAPDHALSMVILPDGTSVALNAGSKITYLKGFGITHRNLRLKGEAYFEVKKNTGIPFIITAGDACIRVTGTQFNVNAYHRHSDIRVTVTEGVVRLYEASAPDRQVTLHAGETGTMNRTSSELKMLPTENLNDLAWKTKIIDFHNTSLEEVAEILMNTYHKEIKLDPALAHCTVTVRFEDRELDAVLSVLRSTLDLKIINKGRHIVISGKGC
jgi:transmembrane sensor